ncbi:hypothetical protein K435DRAFT_790229 [Dendrothele bispora CBS 962.96]|uniref:Uncharacterized protein n=1 Tax=Dendrothele bispora (strain CBS 962.96) TaxID=1314807 RepID=A0A4S8MS21_DENBC|nr:hypothetical protein K435DRAFT_790229 [Dendrothele bispora CBS 962.96]
MEPSQRIDFLTRIYSVPEIGEQDIELTYIAFDFDEWDTQTGQTSETKIEVLVDFSAAEFNTPSSPVTHDINDIVGDRQILSVDEAQDVLAVLKDTQERLSLIDHNIHVLKRIIQVLESHQSAIAKHIALHRAFLAPVNKLPPELLAGM